MYYLKHVTLRRSAPKCPDRVGWLPLCVWTDGRVEVCGKPAPALVEPCTFVQWMLNQRAALTPDVRPVASGADINRMAKLAYQRPRSTM